MHSPLLLVVLCVLALMAGGCAAASAGTTRAASDRSWSIAIHGGAGTFDPDTPAEKQKSYRESLSIALKQGADLLAAGKDGLDVCEAVVRTLENDPKFNAGKGAVYTEIGTHELDASIMDGRTLACGAVAGVKTIKNPISLARLVMEKTNHVLLMSDGAEAFADSLGKTVERVPNTYFDTPERYDTLQKKLRERKQQEKKTSSTTPAATDRRDSYGTVGCVVLDSKGNLAAATSGQLCRQPLCRGFLHGDRRGVHPPHGGA
jgi:beta-aspartyl-peptidase (threonine type)